MCSQIKLLILNEKYYKYKLRMRAKSVLDWSKENPYQAPPSLWLAETESWPVIGGEGGPGPPWPRPARGWV